MNDKRLRELLDEIYGSARAETLLPRISSLVNSMYTGTEAGGAKAAPRFDEKSALLISYADMISPPAGKGPPLACLKGVLEERALGFFSHVHILPFFPWTSDDGFSVADYRIPDPRYGAWEDIEEIGKDFKLAFDLVLNHGSAQSQWFRDFLAGKKERENWYLTRPAGWSSTGVVRPRTSPLLSEFTRSDGGSVFVWTTFSDDQVDFDWSNPEVLLAFIETMLIYAAKGCSLLRLDAIAYLWKEDGTPCIHHPKTHAIVKLLRALIDCYQLPMVLLSETNVPHHENISYFGNGDEAHMVYNFALPPLVLHAAISGDAAPLRDWARDLEYPDEGLFLNFLASHDGIGLTPAKGLVDEKSFAASLERGVERGAHISTKATDDGPIPYELNCSWLSAVAPPSLGLPHHRARAFLATHAVLLSLRGVPAIYFNSLFGFENWDEGPAIRGYNRAINREKPRLEDFEARLADPQGLSFLVYSGLSRLLSYRSAHPAFSPDIPQRILPTDGALFALVRGPDEEGESILCAMNLGPWPAAFEWPTTEGADSAMQTEGEGRQETISSIHISLEPWQTRWIPMDGTLLRLEDELCT